MERFGIRSWPISPGWSSAVVFASPWTLEIFQKAGNKREPLVILLCTLLTSVHRLMAVA